MLISNIEVKKCSCCYRWKELSDFYRRGSGRRSRCKECENIVRAAYREKNRELINTKQRQFRNQNPTYYKDWYRDHHDQALVNDRKYKSTHKGILRERRKKYYQANKEKCRNIFRSWQSNNRDHRNSYAREWRKNNPEKVRLTNQRIRAKRKLVIVNDFTEQQWQELKLLYNYCCAYCGEQVALTIDHVVPLSRGGQNTLNNIVPACGKCNRKKYNRTPDEAGMTLIKISSVA